MVGAIFGDGVHAVLPTAGGSLGAYALVGMGAVLTGAARAPITAVVIMFELTGEYTIILPLMLAVVVATAVSSAISADTVYTRKLLRRGIDIDEPADAAIRRRPIDSLMSTPPAAVRPGTDLRSVAAMFAGRTRRFRSSMTMVATSARSARATSWKRSLQLIPPTWSRSPRTPRPSW
jgi:chloride channel protein, CIC family